MSSRIWLQRPAVLVVFMGILLIVQFGLSVHLAPRLAPAPLNKHGLRTGPRGGASFPDAAEDCAS